MDPQPLVAVADVEESSLWYRQLFGCESGHGGPDYERLVSAGASFSSSTAGRRTTIRTWATPQRDPRVASGRNGLFRARQTGL